MPGTPIDTLAHAPLASSDFEKRLRRAELNAHRATVVSALIGVVAVAGAAWQIHEARRIQREATAFEVYDEYLRVAVQRPELTCLQDPAALAGVLADPVESQRYDILTAIALNAGEQILEARPRDAHWRETVSVTLVCNAPYLTGPWLENGGHRNYSCAMRAFMAENLDTPELRCAAAAP